MNRIICYIDSLYRGGAQRVMAELINQLAQKGYDIILVNNSVSRKNVAEYSISGKIKREYLDNQICRNSLIRNIRRLYNLRRFIKRSAPDIVISFLGHPNIIMLLSTIGLKIKKIVSVRNDPSYEYGSSLFSRVIANTLFKLADGVVFQTEGAQKYFCKKIREKSRVIGNPIDSVFFSTHWNNPNNTIISVGRLESQKNFPLLIQAFNSIKVEIPSYRLEIYGTGEKEESLKRLISDLKIEDSVLLKGHCSNVWEKLEKARLFVLSSDYEGMPNSLMEAMAVGIPIVSTDCPCGGPKTLLSGIDEDILVPCYNVNKLASSIKKILSNPEKQQSISNEIRNRAQRYKSEVIVNEWIGYMQEIYYS